VNIDGSAPIRLRQENDTQALKARLHRFLIDAIDADRADIDAWSPENLKSYLEKQTGRFIAENRIAVNRNETQDLVASMIDELSGLGPIQPLVDDDDVNDILVNGRDRVYVERKGKLELTDIRFNDDRHVQRIIQRIIAPLGRRIDESCPMVDARLHDGSRVNAVIPPVALDGPSLSIRKFRKDPLRAGDLLAYGTFDDAMLKLLVAAVQARCNVIVSGGTGAGKTTLLNVLSQHIPEGERLVTIEDAAELSLGHPHVVRLETRPPNLEGTGEVAARDLVKNALRMRPSRIIVGEVRGDEVVDMLQAMNTGHEGSMTTIHANSARDAITRVEMLVGMGGFKGSDATLRHNIASAIDLVIQVSRLSSGKRKVVSVTELTGVADGTYMMQDLFSWDFDQEKFCSSGVNPSHSGLQRMLGQRPIAARGGVSIG
jgi:pilus assembly protein CpaF